MSLYELSKDNVNILIGTMDTQKRTTLSEELSKERSNAK